MSDLTAWLNTPATKEDAISLAILVAVLFCLFVGAVLEPRIMKLERWIRENKKP